MKKAILIIGWDYEGLYEWNDEDTYEEICNNLPSYEEINLEGFDIDEHSEWLTDHYGCLTMGGEIITEDDDEYQSYVESELAPTSDHIK